MAKIAFILLCHKDPDAIIQQARRLTAAGDCMAIHFDARADARAYRRIRTALDGAPNVTFASKRVKCGWGEWSLVQATLNAVSAALKAFPGATHFYMLSGDCMAIKSAAYAHDFLDAHDVDYIESFDYFNSGWIRTGLKKDRLIYRHIFNERRHKWLFYASLQLQKRLGLHREVPADLQMMIGSQWWCLRRRTIEMILDFAHQRRDVMRFFRTTWIPDESFFQTLVRHLVPAAEINARTLTFLIFSDYGMPVSFYNDQYELLLSQNFLFARKISPDAHELKQRLGDLYASGRADFQLSDEGRRLYRFITERGRIGRRFAPRFWEREDTLGRDRELLMIACKKWHVGKRLLGRITEVTGIGGVEYLFDEENTALPNLGGIESTLEKRTRHRRALLRILFDFFDTRRLIICLDPSSIELMRDFFSLRSTVRLLEVECTISDAYLLGHAGRVGLAGANTPQATLDQLIPTIRNNFNYETDQMRNQNFPNFSRASELYTTEENTVSLMTFLGTSEAKAHEIVATASLFED